MIVFSPELKSDSSYLRNAVLSERRLILVFGIFFDKL